LGDELDGEAPREEHSLGVGPVEKQALVETGCEYQEDDTVEGLVGNANELTLSLSARGGGI